MLRELSKELEKVESNSIYDIAKEQNISKRTLENAKREMGIRAKRENGSWYWPLDREKLLK